MKSNGEHQERRPEHILAEIEHTRSEMDSTLTAIEHRLTPGQLVDQGLDYLKNSGANEFVHNLGGQVKNNPMPIALVGIGLAWLMASSRQPSYSAYDSSGPGLGERAGEMKDRVKDRAESAMSSARSTLDSAKSTMSSAGQRINEYGQSARSGMDYMLREQPLALGAIGLAVGALMAAMAPRTRQEDELMGEARDRLVDRAKEVGQEKLEDAKQVANAAMGTVSKEAEKRGLSPSPSGSQGPSISPRPETPSTGSSIGKSSGTRNIP